MTTSLEHAARIRYVTTHDIFAAFHPDEDAKLEAIDRARIVLDTAD